MMWSKGEEEEEEMFWVINLTPHPHSQDRGRYPREQIER